MTVVFDQALTKSQPLVTKFFVSAMDQGKLAHAYIFVGGNNRDKWLTVRQMALFLNCTDGEKATSGACGIREMDESKRCQSCRWIREGKHPQAWFELKDPDSTTTIIPVDRARQISAELSKTSSYKRVIVVEDASQEVFHRPAANALLKTIEEPRGVLLFAFFARSAEQVLPTIVSRCQIVPFRRDGEELVGPIALTSQGSKEVLSRALAEHRELVPLVASMKDRKFFEWSKSRASRTYGRHSEGESEHAIAVADALDFGKMITDLIDHDHDSDAVIDGAVLTEVEIIGNRAIKEPGMSAYLRDLLKLSEEAKTHLRRYVGKKAAVDCFVIDWTNLRSKTRA
ncbi:hypothetical protein KF707_09100 [Candidatus Obscuribacterales bacterium]|nr:hypothetical protein [Candidatus Obscuribacterales bacterium]